MTFEANVVKVKNDFSDLLGIGKITKEILEYKKFKIKITQENRESLYHIIRKDVLSYQKKTKELIEKILTKYQDKEDFKVSMHVIRLLDYMDDILLNAILSVKIMEKKESEVNAGRWYIEHTELNTHNVKVLFENNLLFDFGATFYEAYYILDEILQIREIYNS